MKALRQTSGRQSRHGSKTRQEFRLHVDYLLQSSSLTTPCQEALTSRTCLWRLEPPGRCVPGLEPWNENESWNENGVIV